MKRMSAEERFIREETAKGFVLGVRFALQIHQHNFPDQSAWREKVRNGGDDFAAGIRDGSRGEML